MLKRAASAGPVGEALENKRPQRRAEEVLLIIFIVAELRASLHGLDGARKGLLAHHL